MAIRLVGEAPCLLRHFPRDSTLHIIPYKYCIHGTISGRNTISAGQKFRTFCLMTFLWPPAGGGLTLNMVLSTTSKVYLSPPGWLEKISFKCATLLTMIVLRFLKTSPFKNLKIPLEQTFVNYLENGCMILKETQTHWHATIYFMASYHITCIILLYVVSSQNSFPCGVISTQGDELFPEWPWSPCH